MADDPDKAINNGSSLRLIYINLEQLHPSSIRESLISMDLLRTAAAAAAVIRSVTQSEEINQRDHIKRQLFMSLPLPPPSPVPQRWTFTHCSTSRPASMPRTPAARTRGAGTAWTSSAPPASTAMDAAGPLTGKKGPAWLRVAPTLVEIGRQVWGLF